MSTVESPSVEVEASVPLTETPEKAGAVVLEANDEASKVPPSSSLKIDTTVIVIPPLPPPPILSPASIAIVREKSRQSIDEMTLSLAADLREAQNNGVARAFMKAAVQLVGRQVEMYRNARQLQEVLKTAQERNQIRASVAREIQALLANSMDDQPVFTSSTSSNKQSLSGILKIGSWKGGQVKFEEAWTVLSKETSTLRFYARQPLANPPVPPTPPQPTDKPAVQSSEGKKEVDSSFVGSLSGLTAKLDALRTTKMANLPTLSLSGFLGTDQEEQEEELVLEIKLDGYIVREMKTKQGHTGSLENCFELVDPLKSLGRALEARDPSDKLIWISELAKCCHGQLFDLARRCYTAENQEAFVRAMRQPCVVPTALLRRIIGDADSAGNKRRHSENLAVAQVIRDVERDLVCMNGELVRGQDGIEYVLGSLALRVMKGLELLEKKEKLGDLGSKGTNDSVSPRNCLTRLEAQAFAFAERVLHGTTRTQSGGDIFDAITAICKNPRCLIVPVNSEADPLELNVTVEENDLVVDARSTLRFRIVPTDGDERAEWAKLAGKLDRRFVFGHPPGWGSVTITAEPPAMA